MYLLGSITFMQIKKFAPMPFYAVAKGRKPGIYLNWADCEEQVKKIYGAVYKKFPTREEAEQFIKAKSNDTLIDRRSVQVLSPEVINVENNVNMSSLPQSAVATTSRNHDESGCDGRLSPTLIKMKKNMKLLQKQLATLRTEFDDYISKNSKNTIINSVTQTKNIHTSSGLSNSTITNDVTQARNIHTSSGVSKKKRNHSPDNDAVENKSSRSAIQSVVNNNQGKIDKSKFSINSDGFVVVYTDGACGNNGRSGARAGVGVYFGPQHPLNVSEPVKGRQTNNTAEIQAGTYALELCRSAGFDKVQINTDSQFMISCMTSWLPSWKKKGWRKSDGGEVKNKEDLMDLDRACNNMLIKWVHVRGHAGIAGNEAADKLAVAGAARSTD